MEPTDDGLLLRRYVEHQSDEAFAALVTRHVNFVYSIALRRVGNVENAQEVTQAVFIIFSKKAAQLRHHKALGSWLFQTTCLTANNFLRSEQRRRNREQEAYMQSLSDESTTDIWPVIAPLLDTAVAALSEKERRAVILRYYEGRNLRELSAVLEASPVAIEKRLVRAMDKLRKFFTRRGITLSVTALAGAVSAHSVQAAPIGLVPTVMAGTAKGAAISSSTLTLIKGAVKIMAWTKAKTAVVVGVAVLLTTGTATVIVTHAVRSGSAIDAYLQDEGLSHHLTAPPFAAVQTTHFPKHGGTIASSTGNKIAGRDCPIELVFEYAYGADGAVYPNTRVIFKGTRPRQTYDFLLTDSQVTRAQFLAEVRRVTGYTAHFETIQTNVLSLRVVEPGKMERASGGGVQRAFSALVNRLEMELRTPVVDQTGLEGYYDYDIGWQPSRRADAMIELKQWVRREFGLELVPDRQPVEMLVIERVKK